MVRTPTFWALWVAYCLGTTAGTMVISQLVPFARNAGHSAAVAAFALTVGAIGSASGRVLSGWMSDYAGRLNTLRVMLLVSACAMPLLFLFRENIVLFYALLALVYYCYGTQLSVYASTSADFYGTKYVGFNYGLLLLAWGVAAILGPFLGGRVYVATGEYRWRSSLPRRCRCVALATLFLAKNPHGAASLRRRGSEGRVSFGRLRRERLRSAFYVGVRSVISGSSYATDSRHPVVAQARSLPDPPASTRRATAAIGWCRTGRSCRPACFSA